jgi:hypothetical protein
VLSKVAYGFPELARALVAHPKVVAKLVLVMGLEAVPAVAMEASNALSAVASHALKDDETAKNAPGTTANSAAIASETKKDGGAGAGQKGDDGDSGSDDAAEKDDCCDLVRTLVDSRKAIAPLFTLLPLRQSKQRGQYNFLMRVATEAGPHS